MNKLKNWLVILSVLFAFSSTSVKADMQGFYIGWNTTMNGIAADGSNTDSQSNATTGTAGKIALIGGTDVGYTYGSEWFVDIGMTNVFGKATMSAKSDDGGTTNDVTFEVSDPWTAYVSVGHTIGDSSAWYAKFGYSEADAKTTGDVTQPPDLEGTTFAVGTKTQVTENFQIRTEVGRTTYDNIGVVGKGTSGGIETTTKFSADPEVAYGGVNLVLTF